MHRTDWRTALNKKLPTRESMLGVILVAHTYCSATYNKTMQLTCKRLKISQNFNSEM